MNKVEESLKLFNDKNSCSQSVFAPWAVALDMDQDTALRLACAFSGGMGGQGMTCGAVTGAFMAISLKYGRVAVDDVAAREKTDQLVKLFIQKFKERNNNKLDCSELLGHDRSNPEDVAFMRENGIFQKICPGCVKDAAEILEEIM